MSKKYLFLILATFSFFLAGVVWAQPNIGLGTAKDIAEKSGLETEGVKDTTLSETIGRYINWALGLTGTIFLLLTIYAGFLWMTAGGDESNIDKAKKIITSSVIGLIIVLLSYSITSLVLHFIVRTSAPKTSGDLIEDGPSATSGCCHIPSRSKCRENKGPKDCANNDGNWYPGDNCSWVISQQNIDCTYEF